MTRTTSRRSDSGSRPKKIPERPKRIPEQAKKPEIDKIPLLGVGLKAGVAGGIAMTVLLIVGQLPIRLLACLLVPGFFVILIGTGILAGLLGGDNIQTRAHATQAGMIAGIVVGISAGLVAMVLSALGIMFVGLGQGVVAQFTPAQIQSLDQVGISTDIIRMGGAVMMAFLIWGIGGTLVSLLLSALGGRLYFRLR